MNEAKATLQTRVTLQVWELLCLLLSCTLLGAAISSHQGATLGHNVPALPAAIFALMVLLAPILYRRAGNLLHLAAKPRQDPTGEPPMQPKTTDEEAVSPVIGVILMVAITVVLAGVLFVLVSKLTSTGATQAPHIELGTNDNGKTYYVISSTATLPYTDLGITGCTGIPAGPNVAAGDTWTTCSGTLTVTHKPTNTILYRSQ